MDTYLENSPVWLRILLYGVGHVGSPVEDGREVVDITNVNDNPSLGLEKAVRSHHCQLILSGTAEGQK